jgi:hypothetical protein
MHIKENGVLELFEIRANKSGVGVLPNLVVGKVIMELK